MFLLLQSENTEMYEAIYKTDYKTNIIISAACTRT